MITKFVKFIELTFGDYPSVEDQCLIVSRPYRAFVAQGSIGRWHDFPLLKLVRSTPVGFCKLCGRAHSASSSLFRLEARFSTWSFKDTFRSNHDLTTTTCQHKRVPRSLMIARGTPNLAKRDFRNLQTTLASLVGSAFRLNPFWTSKVTAPRIYCSLLKREQGLSQYPKRQRFHKTDGVLRHLIPLRSFFIVLARVHCFWDKIMISYTFGNVPGALHRPKGMRRRKRSVGARLNVAVVHVQNASRMRMSRRDHNKSDQLPVKLYHHLEQEKHLLPRTVESHFLQMELRIRGTRGSGSNSTTTKSAGNWNFPTNTRTSLAIPIGVVIERSASSSVMHVGVSSERERSFYTEYGIRLMLAPRSAKALHVLMPENSHGIRNLSGSPSFLGNLSRMTAEQFV
ncbi:hypothetical protein Tco_1354339 [Tanacetum coccineum]